MNDTRARLIAAAELLFAERGIDGVSLNEINRAAEQRNASALQYHFGDREGLLRAILDKHRPPVEARRDALLDQYRDAGVADLRALAAALVLPLVTKLSDPDGGRECLRVLGELVMRPDPPTDLLWGKGGSGIERWRAFVDPFLASETTRALHVRFAAVRFCHVELASRAAARPRRDDRLFASRLVDLVTALLSTPFSDQTTRLLHERDR